MQTTNLRKVGGREQRGHCPVLIASPDNFNAANKASVVLPITNSAAFATRFDFGVDLIGIKTTGVIRCDQPRTLDLSERGGRRVERLPANR